ncbi:hypothetical protein QOT17_010639 [Balamuthia mandrillaris]
MINHLQQNAVDATSSSSSSSSTTTPFHETKTSLSEPSSTSALFTSSPPSNARHFLSTGSTLSSSSSSSSSETTPLSTEQQQNENEKEKTKEEGEEEAVAMVPRLRLGPMVLVELQETTTEEIETGGEGGEATKRPKRTGRPRSRFRSQKPPRPRRSSSLPARELSASSSPTTTSGDENEASEHLDLAKVNRQVPSLGVTPPSPRAGEDGSPGSRLVDPLVYRRPQNHYFLSVPQVWRRSPLK